MHEMDFSSLSCTDRVGFSVWAGQCVSNVKCGINTKYSIPCTLYTESFFNLVLWLGTLLRIKLKSQIRCRSHSFPCLLHIPLDWYSLLCGVNTKNPIQWLPARIQVAILYQQKSTNCAASAYSLLDVAGIAEFHYINGVKIILSTPCSGSSFKFGILIE